MVVGVFGFYSLFSETNGIFLSRGVTSVNCILEKLLWQECGEGLKEESLT